MKSEDEIRRDQIGIDYRKVTLALTASRLPLDVQSTLLKAIRRQLLEPISRVDQERAAKTALWLENMPEEDKKPA